MRLPAIVGAALAGAILAAQPASADAWVERKTRMTLPNGIELAFVRWGDPAGPPLVLLHEGSDTSRSWSLMEPELARFDVHALDLRGHGGSAAPECCYALADLAHDVKLFLDARGIARASVVGHSLGSMVAQAFAAAYPERVERLVLVGAPAGQVAKHGDWFWRQIGSMQGPAALTGELVETLQATPDAFDRA